MNLITNGGDRISAKTPDDVVRRLHEMSFTKAPSDSEFMSQMAERVLTSSGEQVNTSSPEEFVFDLIRIGYLKEEG